MCSPESLPKIEEYSARCPGGILNGDGWKKTNGLDNYLVINGRARVTEGGASELLNQLAQIYVAPGTIFAPDGSPQGYITHITVERIYGIGPWIG